jgi:hypothetical protein
MTQQYRKRIADDILLRKLSGAGAVLVEGPKWCGKTTTCEQFAKSALYMADPDTRERNLALAATNIKELLKGETPRLIDEWQVAPKFWDAVRFHVDHAEGWGHFILTGSAVPPEGKKAQNGEKDIVHSGTGRISRLRMRPMSLWESGESTGTVSLRDLFAGSEPSGESTIKTLNDIAWLICRGGWPQAVEQTGDVALDRAVDYYEAVAASDISRVDGVERNPARVRRLMRSFARLQGTQALLPTIRRDMQNGRARAPNDDTIRSYLNALEKIFVIEDMPAWSPCLRSKTTIRTSDTRYFTDPSIAAAAMGLGPGDLMNDIQSLGFFFEAFAVRDLRVYAEALGGAVSHFLDRNGLECDAVVHLRNGSSGLVEVKLGGEALIEEGASTLNALSGLLDTTRMKAVAFKMVLVAVGRYAYRRPDDNVIVCPIGCLKP